MRVAPMMALLVSLASLLSAGCFSALQDGDGQGSDDLSGGAAGGCAGAGCRHGAAAGGSGGGSSGAASGSSGGSTGVAASSSGSTTGGAASTSSSGASGGSSGGSTGAFDAGIDCPDLYLASQALDLALHTPIVGATISAVGINGVVVQGASASSDSNGYFAVCVPTGVEFTLEVTAEGYPESALEDVALQKSETLEFATGGMPLVSSSDLTAFGSIIPYDPSLGAVLVSVNSLSKAPLCYDSAGWELSLVLPDGGTLPDGGNLQYQQAYLDTTFLPDPTLTATTAAGNAFFYGIDPNVTDRVAIVAVNTNANASMCPIINSQEGLEGTAYIASQVLTFAPILNP